MPPYHRKLGCVARQTTETLIVQTLNRCVLRTRMSPPPPTLLFEWTEGWNHEWRGATLNVCCYEGDIKMSCICEDQSSLSKRTEGPITARYMFFPLEVQKSDTLKICFLYST